MKKHEIFAMFMSGSCFIGLVIAGVLVTVEAVLFGTITKIELVVRMCGLILGIILGVVTMNCARKELVGNK